MKFFLALSISVGLLSAALVSADVVEEGIWQRRPNAELKSSRGNSIKARNPVSAKALSRDESSADYGLADDDESDYVSGVYEKLSSMLEKIQPSVDQIAALSSNANDKNADEYSEKISKHLDFIVAAGDSVVNEIQTEETSPIEAEVNNGIEPQWCHRCHKKKHHKHRHCHECKKRDHDECGHLLKKWVYACKVSTSAVLTCKTKKVKDKCEEHVPKVTKCATQVVNSCGKYGISQAFRSVAQSEIDAFSKIGYGSSAISEA
uniref:Secreted protein n=1 Tax=Phakopsora pachyrhizi TaxID=170000 RepID=A0A0S1MJG1_PHAPC